MKTLFGIFATFAVMAAVSGMYLLKKLIYISEDLIATYFIKFYLAYEIVGGSKIVDPVEFENMNF